MAKANKNKSNKKTAANKTSSKTSKKQSTQNAAALSQAIINHLSSLNFTSVSDLSDYYSKIGTTSSNNISDVSKYAIDTSNQNLLIINDKKTQKEYESKNESLYVIILKDENDPDSTIEIVHRYKKSGAAKKMTIDQLYSYMTTNLATKQDIQNLDMIQRSIISIQRLTISIQRLIISIQRLTRSTLD